MGNWFQKHQEVCNRWQDWLDAGASGDAPASAAQDLMATRSLQDEAHLQDCPDCRLAMDAWLVARQSLQSLSLGENAAPPWFASRVMASIAARQDELLRPAAAWSIVPRFASRLVWATAAVLLLASTWLYQTPPAAPSAAPSMNSTEGLFDTQPALSKDEVLMSLAETNHE